MIKRKGLRKPAMPNAAVKTNAALSNKGISFFQKKVTFGNYFSESLKITLLVLLVLLFPYLAGIAFLLLFFSNLNPVIMQYLYHLQSYFLTWCIGYEILAIIFLLYLLKKFISIQKSS